MKQAFHIFRKDLRRFRWVIVAWGVIVAGRALIDTIGAEISLGALGPLLAIQQMSAMSSFIYALSLAILVARVVQEEPLVGRDAFWLTRPMASSSVLQAKLAFALLFLTLIPLLGRIFVAAWFGAGDIARIVPGFLLNQLLAVTLLWAIATLTPSLTRYVVTIVGVIGAFIFFTASTLLIALFVAAEGDEGGDYQLPDMTPAVVAAGLIILAAVAVIVTQYRRRRILQSLAAGTIGLLLAFLIPPNWKWSFSGRPTAESVSLPTDTPALVVRLEGDKPRVSEGMRLSRRAPPRNEIAVPATVSGLPAEFNIRAMVGRSRFELSNGVTLEDRRRPTQVVAYLGMGGSWIGRESAVAAALGGVRLLNQSPKLAALSGEQWTVVLRVEEEDFIRYRSERGRLTTDVDIVFERAIPRNSLPLVAGASAELHDVENKIVRVLRRATGCTVLFRRSYVESLLTPREHSNVTYALRNPSRREAIYSGVTPFHAEGFSVGSFFLPTTRVGGRGFVLEQYALEFPDRRGFERAGVDVDQAWFDGAELVIVEMVSAGHLTRRVTLDGFRMTP